MGNNIDVDGLSGVLTTLEGVKPDNKTTAWEVGSDVEYSIYVEYGTSKMQAQPYLRPAVNQTMREADKYLARADDVDEFIELLAKSVEEKATARAPVDTGRLKRSITAEKIE